MLAVGQAASLCTHPAAPGAGRRDVGPLTRCPSGPPAFTRQREYPYGSLRRWESAETSARAAGRNPGAPRMFLPSSPRLRLLSALSAGASGTPACPRRRCPVEELVAGFPWGKSCLWKAAGSGAPACPVAADLCFDRDFLMCLPAKAVPGETGAGGRGRRFYQQRNVGTVFVSLTLPPSQKKKRKRDES